MTIWRWSCALFLAVVAVLALWPALIVDDAYDAQFRENIDESPSARFPLGTDALGRNRLARLLYGVRTSLALAPLAAAGGVALAGLAGIWAASAGRVGNRVFELAVDLMSSLPWLFALIAVRAALPLDASPALLTGTTFALLAALGWAGPARVIRNVAAAARSGNWFLQAKAGGVHPVRIWLRYAVPAILPVAAAQFWINVPVFILSEANLGLLGLGVAEPTPSLGNLMRELENVYAIPSKPWVLAPVVLVALLVLSMQSAAPKREIQL